jgi:hypothetical protein
MLPVWESPEKRYDTGVSWTLEALKIFVDLPAGGGTDSKGITLHGPARWGEQSTRIRGNNRDDFICMI